MERRLRLLLDRERYAKVEREARQSGRTVSAVIREAIDVRFAEDLDARSEAATRLLADPPTGVSPVPDWSATKESFDREVERRVPWRPTSSSIRRALPWTGSGRAQRCVCRADGGQPFLAPVEGRQDPQPGLGHRDGVLPVRGARAVARHDGPLVGEDPGVG